MEEYWKPTKALKTKGHHGNSFSLVSYKIAWAGVCLDINTPPYRDIFWDTFWAQNDSKYNIWNVACLNKFSNSRQQMDDCVGHTSFRNQGNKPPTFILMDVIKATFDVLQRRSSTSLILVSLDTRAPLNLLRTLMNYGQRVKASDSRGSLWIITAYELLIHGLSTDGPFIIPGSVVKS